MKCKLDENLPVAVAESLRELGHDVDTVVDEDIVGTDDPTVLAAATSAGRLVITLDRGFGDIRRYPPGTHAGILVIRADDQSPRSVTQSIAELTAAVDLDELSGCISVWRDGKLRRRQQRA